MRRGLRKVLPALSYHFGIKWADVEDMPSGELDAYLFALEQLNDEARKAR